jgi:diguanylate cyclase
MFWSKEKGDNDRNVSQATPTSSRKDRSVETEAIETVAAMLRSLSRHAFDLDDRTSSEIRETFEKWALRLLVGETERDPSASSQDGGIRRDWGTLKRTVESHKKDEYDYVTKALDNLRQAVREFVRYTTATLRAERENDLALDTYVDRLERALVTGDHEKIREASSQTAQLARKQILLHRQREHEVVLALKETIGSLKNELDEARKAATIDALTQVFNRGSLDQHIRAVTDQAFLTGTPTCLVMVDLDHFKAVNDGFGHPIGDMVLREVADAIVRAFLRKEDFVARYGGEEFCVVAEHATFEATRERAERLRKAVEELKIHAGTRTIPVSVSFGIAALEPGESPKSWLSRADAALYRAKEKGRNRISVAPPLTRVALFDAARASSGTSHLHVDRTPAVGSDQGRRSSHAVLVSTASEDPGPPPSPVRDGSRNSQPPRAIAALLKR